MVAGWSCLVAGSAWVPSRLAVVDGALEVLQRGLPGPVVLRFVEVMALDQLDDPALPAGEAMLELQLASGAVAFVRVPDPMVDRIVDELQASREVVEAPPAVEPPDDPPPPPPGRGGGRAALAAEVAALREYLDELGFAQRRALREDLDSLARHRAEAVADLRAVTARRRSEEVALVRVRRDAVLQEAGIYRPRHPAEDSPARAARLAEVQTALDELIRAGEAVSGTDDWTVNGSVAEGRKVVSDLCALLLRTYNAEADLLLEALEPEGLDAAIDRLTVTRATIERLGASMSIALADDLHRLRVEELTLAADQLADERDERRRLHAVPPDGHDHLLVTSNPGSFGADVVRIAATATFDVEAARHEADGGRLPFPSDVHALVPVTDAASVLAALTERFADRRCNLADPAARHFRVAPAEVRDALVDLGVTVVRFAVDAPAGEWRRSNNVRAGRDDAA